MYTVIDSNLDKKDSVFTVVNEKNAFITSLQEEIATLKESVDEKVAFRDSRIVELKDSVIRLNGIITDLNRDNRNQTREILTLEYNLAKVSGHIQKAYQVIKKEDGK